MQIMQKVRSRRALIGAACLVFLNDNLGMPSDSSEQAADTESASMGLAPGEERTLVLPFKVNANNLADRSLFDDFDPSNFCIQTTDYATATTYRLWL